MMRKEIKARPGPARSQLRWSPLLLLAAVLLLLPMAAQAEELPEGVVQHEENIFSKTLDNGMEVVVVQDASVPLVTIEMVVRNGAFTEAAEYDGLSHLYEHMFFKGNEAIPNQEAYMARQRELGMSWNGTTSTERVNYFFTLSSDKFQDGMVFMRDAIRYPLFDQKELEKERVVVLDELSRNEANPYFHLRKAVDNALWYAYPSHKNTIGDRQIIETATREKMLTVQRKYYVPNNSALFLAGDVELEPALELAEELYGDWEQGPDPFQQWPLPEHPPLQTSEVVVVEKPVEDVTITLNWHGPDTRDDRDATYAADVFSFILDQQNSKFSQALVESGIALGAGVSYYTQQNVGPISVSLRAQPDKLEEAVRALGDQLEKFDDADYYTDDQIATAKTLLEVDDIYGREKTSEFTHTLSFWWSTAGLDYYLNYIDKLKKVTRDDMNRYVQTYIQGKPMVVGLILSKENQDKLQLTEDKVLGWLEGE